MRRVMVIGGPGAGKTTFARRLGELTGLPVTSLDRIYWLPDWTPRPAREGDRLAREAAAGEAWIIEGNYSATFPERLKRVDTIVFLDFGTTMRLRRVVMRTLRHFGRVRPDMAEGCPERFDWGFLKWTANYRNNGRARAERMLATLPKHIRVVRLATPRDVRRFLDGCRDDMSSTEAAAATRGEVS